MEQAYSFPRICYCKICKANGHYGFQSVRGGEEVCARCGTPAAWVKPEDCPGHEWYTTTACLRHCVLCGATQQGETMTIWHDIQVLDGYPRMIGCLFSNGELQCLKPSATA